ncbi:MAG: hypothetical protein QOD06_702, partial [Candidatus Binatota bacterium]|nr:hypothetical protein [Candidatus Binatota bacterium]
YFSLKAGVRWPLDVLAEEGFAYDSSILPIDRLPGLELVSPRSPYALRADLWEVPIAVSRFGFWHLPMLGGFALRALPEAFVRRRLEQFEAEIGPAVLHVHPWEIDPGAPEAESVPRAVRGLKRVGRKGLAGKLRRLLRAYSFGSIAEVFPESRGAGARPIAAKLAPSA